jgi:hypothetical protein
MEDKNANLRNQIALGWVLMLLVLTLTTALMIIQASFTDDNFHSLKVDPGPRSLSFLVFVFGIYVVMPIYVYIVHPFRIAALRWTAVVFSALILLFFVLHHTSHWVHGDRPNLSSHVMDVLHHIVGLWIFVNSIRWARALETAPVTA